MLVNKADIVASLLERLYLNLRDTREAGIQMHASIYVSQLRERWIYTYLF